MEARDTEHADCRRSRLHERPDNPHNASFRLTRDGPADSETRTMKSDYRHARRPTSFAPTDDVTAPSWEKTEAQINDLSRQIELEGATCLAFANSGP